MVVSSAMGANVRLPDVSVPDELLLRLRLRGMVEDDAGAASGPLVAAGFAVRRQTMLALTPAGRAEAERYFRLDVNGETFAAIRAGYEKFLPLNATLIRLCHDWQVRSGGGPNDHADTHYDWGVIDRLVALDEQVGPVARRLARDSPRFAGYRERLRTARSRVEGGDHVWFVSPRHDSYHTVWMELHEDLLLALGVERGAEGADGEPDA